MNFKITNGSVEYGAETILEEINIEIKEKEKIAIIGRNGAGKSTLLKAIINNDLLTQGTGEEKFNIYKEGNPVIGYLKQMEFEDDQITMIDEILKVYKPITNLEQKIEQIVEKMQTDKSEELAKEYSKAMDKYEFLDGYTYKMLNSIKAGNKKEFMDIVIRLHMAMGKDVSPIFIETMQTTGLDFESIGHSFLAGLISNKYEKKEEEKING